MEKKAFYIPKDRRRAISRGETLEEKVTGTALFADISGFTQLTELLVHVYGTQRGAEELTRRLNEVYDALINELHQYGGVVISFAGDAITCWFNGDTGLQAATCALAMQWVMEGFTNITVPAAQEAVSLAMKVAITRGRARRFVIGAPEIQQIDVLVGKMLERLATAEHLAKKGEVVADMQVLAALAEQVSLRGTRVDPETGEQFGVISAILPAVVPEPNTIPLESEPTGEIIRPWLLPPIYERLQSGGGEFLAEMRPAIALFLRFQGIDYDGDEEAGAKLDAFVRWIQQVLTRYEGFMLQLNVGDKGSYLYAAYGAPIAHEDDAVRAISAALEIRTPPPDLNFIQSIQIGISLGRARTGAYGGHSRRTYGVLGDEVNLAARLMQAAKPGQILVSQPVQQAAKENFIWEHLPPIRVKGKADEILIFSPVDHLERSSLQLQAPSYQLPLVGRRQELNECRVMFERVLLGSGQVIRVKGDPGVGKSRLVGEVIRLAVEMGAVGYGGECEAYGVDTSYLVWQPVWQGFFNLQPGRPLEEQISNLEEKLESIDPEFLPRMPLLGTVLNLPIPDNELTRSLDAKLRKSSLEALLADCLRVMSRGKPTVIVLEDCQWMDPLSQDLLEVIGRTVTDLPVLLLLAYRSSALRGEEGSRIAALPNFAEISLGTFSDEEARDLIEYKLGKGKDSSKQVPEIFAQQIIQRTGGNPFYIEELLNYLNDRGIDPQNQDQLAALDLPTSMHSLILSRLDQLNEGNRTTLKVASVIGRLFRAAYLLGMHPSIGNPEEVQERLKTLADSQMTVQDASEPELTYFFKQIVTQEVAYENLPFATRKTLHEQLARFIEKNYPERLEQQIPILAYHYLKGQAWDKAMDYNLLAAQRAQKEFANETAISDYKRALEAASRLDSKETIEQRLSAHESLGEVLTLTGSYEEALEHFQSARQIVEDRPDTPERRRHQADLCRKTAEVYERLSDYDIAFDWLQRGLDYFQDQIPSIEIANIYLLGAGVFHRQGKNDDAIAWCKRSINSASAIHTRESKQIVARVNYLLGLIFTRRGDLDQAVKYCQESIQLYESIEDIVGQALAYLNLSNAFAEMGDWERASKSLSKSLALNKRVGDIYHQGFVSNNLAQIQMDRGEWEESLELLQQSTAIWQQVGATFPEAVTLSNLAQVYIYLENWTEAHENLEKAQQIFTNIGADDFMPELERRWGEYFFRMGFLDDALEHVRLAEQIALEQEARLDVGMANRLKGEILLARGELDGAETSLKHSLKILKEMNSEFEAARTVISLGQWVLAGGRGDSLTNELAWAINIFERLGAKVDLEQAHAIQAELNK